MTLLAILLVCALIFLVLGYMGKPGIGAIIASVLFLSNRCTQGECASGIWIWTGLFVAIGAVLMIPALRQSLITSRVLKVLAPMLPRISATELEALEAGTVWWDADLFSGKPDWDKLLKFKAKGLTEKEQAFLAGPVETVCRMVDNEQVDREGDLTPEVWQYLKDNGFMSLIIPEAYGGLDF
ncbi:MAG: acyl-CoA dehydrogenase, partial [Planctomycetota bacterium]|nr:acyl-CoA dehydrogenase [Planctomycetota bacterium]